MFCVQSDSSCRTTYSGRRKMSHPTTTLGIPPSVTATRRLSEVTRRLSTTIGWRSLGGGMSPSLSGAIVDDAKGLCAQYIRARFRRSGIVHRKLGLQRLRSVLNMTTSYHGGTCDVVFPSLDLLGRELEGRHRKLYGSICRQICRTVTSEESVRGIFNGVAHELLSTSGGVPETLTWTRVVALFAVAGGLAVDCVQQGHVDYVLKVIDCFGQFVERELVTWIAQHGGWNTLTKIVRPRSGFPLSAFATAAALFVVVALLCCLW